ncbi:hypothetical protein R5R35_011644 [Gryllus longicercus]
MVMIINIPVYEGHTLKSINTGKSYSREENKNVCQTQQCKEAASTLLESMNKDVDACEDFYQFACGKWVQKHPVPPTESHRNQFDLVMEKLDYQLKDILEERENPSDPTPVAASKRFYSACMDTETVEEEGLDLLNIILDQLGGWPIASAEWQPETFSWSDMLAVMTRRLAVTPLILTYVYLDRKNSSRSIITIDQPPLVLPRSMLVEPDVYGHQLQAYRKWIVETAHEIAKAKNIHIPPTRIHVDSFDIVEFEIELAKLTSPNELRRNAYRTYNVLTIKELQQWTDSAEIVNPQTRIRWLDFIKEIFRHVNVEIGADEKIVVKELDYLIKLLQLLDSTPTRTIANYLHWRIVKTSSRDTTAKMRQLAFDFEKVLSGAKEDQPRWRDCIFRTSGSLSFAVGYKYVSHYFDFEAKKAAVEMVKNIRGAFISQVHAIDWMDEETKKVAVEKAEAMTELIGYPDWYANVTALEQYYKGTKVGKSHLANVVASKTQMVHRVLSKLRQPTDRTEWNTSPDVVNAYYNPQTNSIIFPAGILQSPFFNKGRIEALNYGSIGVVIGHEITHGFDDMGRQSDKYGNLAQWWSESTIETYLRKSQCFIDQYDHYRVPELDHLLKTEVTMNGVTTQGENIADNGGLRQAFLAYQQFIQNNGPEMRLPGMEEFSPEQLFFLGFATVWCESTTSESLLQEVLSDPHSPHKLRVLGTLANSEDFAKAFNCAPGSQMNPKIKCMIW